MKRVLILGLAIVLLPACQSPTPEPESPAQEPESPTPAPLVVDGMINGVQVGELLFGGQPSEQALEYLAAEGYKTILSTRGEGEVGWDEKAAVEALGMRFVHIPMNKPVVAITDEQVEQFDEAMAQAEHPMVLHYGSGNRVSGLWAVWLAERQHVEPEEALRLAEQTGMSGVRPVVEQRLQILVREE